MTELKESPTLTRRKYIMLWKLPPQVQQCVKRKGVEDYEERCNACYRARQYDKINRNKFSSGIAVDTMRLNSIAPRRHCLQSAMIA